MKKITTLALIGLLSVNLMACGNVKDKTKGTENTAVESTKENVAFNLTEKSEIKGDFKIPNPEKSTGKEDVVIHKCKYKKKTVMPLSVNISCFASASLRGSPHGK